ncbi:MAG: asparagine--tRNA ligase, partial [Lachnospiraceae bacterium]|nr:asparagine--tRNA ligase [Lachnospiraceae bacterium]
MKDLVDLKELFRSPAEFEGRNLTVCGWTRNRRNSKTFGFIMLNDGTSFNSIQVVYDQTLPNFDEIQHINIGASLIVEGKLLLTPEAQQAFEIHAEKITVEGASTPDYPLQPKPHSVEFLRTIPHLRARTNLFSAVFRIRSLAAHAIHCFFQERGFVYVHTPLITGSDCE